MAKKKRLSNADSWAKRRDSSRRFNAARRKYYDAVEKGDVEGQKQALEEWKKINNDQNNSYENEDYHIQVLRFAYKDNKGLANDHSDDLAGVYAGEFAEAQSKVIGKQIANYWENAGYKEQEQRKAYNEKGKAEADKKAAEAKKNVDYFIKRQKEVLKSNQQTFNASLYNEKTGKYDKTAHGMSRADYLAHLRREKNRWEKIYSEQLNHSANYAYGVRSAAKKMEEIKQEEAKKQVKKDSKKGNGAKKKVRSSKKPPQSTVIKANNPGLPKEVEEYGRTLKGMHNLITRKDSKGNYAYIFEQDGKPVSIMTQMNGQKISSAINVKSEEMQALIKQINENSSQKGSDFTEIIGKINQAELDAAKNAVKIEIAQFTPEQEDSLRNPDARPVEPTVTTPPTATPEKQKVNVDENAQFAINFVPANVQKFMKENGMIDEKAKFMTSRQLGEYLKTHEFDKAQADKLTSYLQDKPARQAEHNAYRSQIQSKSR